MSSKRYVILEHDWPTRHWDLMLEEGDHLRTWRLAEPPQVGRPVAAEESFPHRMVYLDYEGPVSGDRGRVDRWDAGTYVLLRMEPDQVGVHLTGTRLTGTLTLARRDGDIWQVAYWDSSKETGSTDIGSPDEVNDWPAM